MVCFLFIVFFTILYHVMEDHWRKKQGLKVIILVLTSVTFKQLHLVFGKTRKKTIQIDICMSELNILTM